MQLRDHGLKHLALGSTAERVVRYSPCPVLVVRPDDQKKKAGRNGGAAKRELSFSKILVPIDFSECSMKGLAYAKALARQFGSKLVLLHAVALLCYITSDEYARYDFPLLMQQTEKAARDQMRNLIEKTDWNRRRVVSANRSCRPASLRSSKRRACRCNRDFNKWHHRVQTHRPRQHGGIRCETCILPRSGRAEPGTTSIHFKERKLI
jgi:nucleotide-binding universal stress UspA family protein